MQRWIALLRGINISGQKIIRMEDLRKLLSGKGLDDVKTYIQSGNVVFGSRETDHQRLAVQITDAIREHYGFEVPVWVLKAEEIRTYLDNNPFVGELYDPKRVFFSLLDQEPDTIRVDELLTRVIAPEALQIRERMVYLYIPDNYARSGLNNNLVEKALKRKATTRNANTLEALFRLATAE